jgi:hypothetical protein
MDKKNEPQPFMLSLSKHEWLDDAPFDKLRVNGYELTERKNMSSRLWTP